MLLVPWHGASSLSAWAARRPSKPHAHLFGTTCIKAHGVIGTVQINCGYAIQVHHLQKRYGAILLTSLGTDTEAGPLHPMQPL